MAEKPFDIIKEKLSEIIPKEYINQIPNKWEKIGDILTFILPKNLDKYKSEIGETYASVLNCKTVLNDIGGITGEYRKPNVEKIFGLKNTETIHKENGIRYKLDPTKVMFSSGNMDERIRMANISNNDEVVVDLFAGIGYLSLPIAVYSKPKRIFAIEKNPISYNYLVQNISLNNVVDIVEPIKGDNRKITPKNVADRVIMGYFDTQKFLPTAFSCLKNGCGIIHYHDKLSDDEIPEKPLNSIKKLAEEYNRKANLIQLREVKSYAPGISHYVFDINIGEK